MSPPCGARATTLLSGDSDQQGSSRKSTLSARKGAFDWTPNARMPCWKPAYVSSQWPWCPYIRPLQMFGISEECCQGGCIFLLVRSRNRTDLKLAMASVLLSGEKAAPRWAFRKEYNRSAWICRPAARSHTSTDAP